jgi:hypothetical protein
MCHLATLHNRNECNPSQQIAIRYIRRRVIVVPCHTTPPAKAAPINRIALGKHVRQQLVNNYVSQSAECTLAECVLWQKVLWQKVLWQNHFGRITFCTNWI